MDYFGQSDKDSNVNDDDYFREGNTSVTTESALIHESPTSWKDCMSKLWNLDEYRVLKVTNPDGYFYLLFLKGCTYFYLTLTCLSCMAMIPLYNVIHRP